MGKKRLTWLALLLVLLLGAASALAGDKEQLEKHIDAMVEAAKSGRMVLIRSDRLYQEYQRNEVAADKKYRGKWLEVEAWVQGISRDMHGNPYVSLLTDQYGIGEVQARLFPVQVGAIRGKGDYDVISAEDMAASLRKGQHIKVDGLGAGSVMGLPRMDSCVILPAD